MRAYDDAKTCEIVGVLLALLRFLFYIKDDGHYSNDRVIIPRKICQRNIERLRTELFLFKRYQLNITINTNFKVISCLDVTLDLNKVYYEPYIKDLYNHGYFNPPS